MTFPGSFCSVLVIFVTAHNGNNFPPLQTVSGKIAHTSPVLKIALHYCLSLTSTGLCCVNSIPSVKTHINNFRLSVEWAWGLLQASRDGGMPECLRKKKCPSSILQHTSVVVTATRVVFGSCLESCNPLRKRLVHLEWVWCSFDFLIANTVERKAIEMNRKMWLAIRRLCNES